MDGEQNRSREEETTKGELGWMENQFRLKWFLYSLQFWREKFILIELHQQINIWLRKAYKFSTLAFRLNCIPLPPARRFHHFQSYCFRCRGAWSKRTRKNKWMKSFSTADWIELHFNCTHIHFMRYSIKVYSRFTINHFIVDWVNSTSLQTHSKHITTTQGKKLKFIICFPRCLCVKSYFICRKTYLQSKTEKKVICKTNLWNWFSFRSTKLLCQCVAY